jgi:hypothetical protein
MNILLLSAVLSFFLILACIDNRIDVTLEWAPEGSNATAFA